MIEKVNKSKLGRWLGILSTLVMTLALAPELSANNITPVSDQLKEIDRLKSQIETGTPEQKNEARKGLSRYADVGNASATEAARKEATKILQQRAKASQGERSGNEAGAQGVRDRANQKEREFQRNRTSEANVKANTVEPLKNSDSKAKGVIDSKGTPTVNESKNRSAVSSLKSRAQNVVGSAKAGAQKAVDGAKRVGQRVADGARSAGDAVSSRVKTFKGAVNDRLGVTAGREARAAKANAIEAKATAETAGREAARAKNQARSAQRRAEATLLKNVEAQTNAILRGDTATVDAIEAENKKAQQRATDLEAKSAEADKTAKRAQTRSIEAREGAKRAQSKTVAGKVKSTVEAVKNSKAGRAISKKAQAFREWGESTSIRDSIERKRKASAPGDAAVSRSLAAQSRENTRTRANSNASNGGAEEGAAAANDPRRSRSSSRVVGNNPEPTATRGRTSTSSASLSTAASTTVKARSSTVVTTRQRSATAGTPTVATAPSKVTNVRQRAFSVGATSPINASKRRAVNLGKVTSPPPSTATAETAKTQKKLQVTSTNSLNSKVASLGQKLKTNRTKLNTSLTNLKATASSRLKAAGKGIATGVGKVVSKIRPTKKTTGAKKR